MPELLTMQDLANGHLDVKALGEAANGDENTIVTTRTGNKYPSAERAINIMFQNGGLPAKPFATKASMTASALVDGDYAMVTEDTVNNGLYVKTAGAWVKSEYDPLMQAKEYADSKIPIVNVQYVNGNLVGAKSLKLLGKGVSASGGRLEITSAKDMVVVPVKAGSTVYLYNDVNKYSPAVNGGGVIWFKDNTFDLASSLALTSSTNTTLLAGTTVLVSVVPEGVTHVGMVTRFNANVMQPVIYERDFRTPYKEGEEILLSVGGANVYDKLKDNVISNTVADGNLYDGNISYGLYLSNATPPSLVGGQATWGVAYVSIEKGKRYLIDLTGANLGWVRGVVSENTKAELDATPSLRNLWKSFTLKPYDLPNSIYEVVLPAEITNPKTLIFNISMNTAPYNHDMRNTFALWEYFVQDKEHKKVINKLEGVAIKDAVAREQLGKLNPDLITPFLQGKSIYYFGDSITAGTQGGYQQYLEKRLGTKTVNYGVSGYVSRFMRGIATGTGLNGELDISPPPSEPDYTKCDIATIFIGTNELTYGLAHFNSAASIPNASLYESSVGQEKQFLKDNYGGSLGGNIAAVVEYMRYKNPKIVIYLISMTQRTSDKTTGLIVDYNKYYKEIAAKCNVTYLDATTSSPLSINTISQWSYDGLHFNALGNELFGTWLAQKIASAG